MKNEIKFTAESYTVTPKDGAAMVRITGKRAGRPNRRFVLRQKGLKVSSASITLAQKNKVTAYNVTRINHLPSFGQVRLHTASDLYPGDYEISLVFRPYKQEDLRTFISTGKGDLAELMPYFDDGQPAKINLINPARRAA